MLVKNWMSKDVISVGVEDSMMRASKRMKDHEISRLPVLNDEGKLVGIVSDRDIKEASPSKATTLDVHELYYLLSEIKVKDIMTRHPLFLRVDESIEKAAVIMREKGIGGLPVLNDKNELVGILTEDDIFTVLTEITRVHDGGIQMGFELSREPGALKPILDILTESGARILSIITVYPKGDENRRAFLRIFDMDKEELNAIRDRLSKDFNLLYWVRDNVDST